MEQSNLDIYGNAALPWSRALAQIESADPFTTWWLSTTCPDGRPHSTGVGAQWTDSKIYFVSGPGTRKSRNLAQNPNCVFGVTLRDLDLTVEGAAARVTDEATLERLAGIFAERGWPASVSDGAITAPYSAPSAGPSPWYLYVVTPVTVVGVARAEPYGATRWRFDAAAV